MDDLRSVGRMNSRPVVSADPRRSQLLLLTTEHGSSGVGLAGEREDPSSALALVMEAPEGQWGWESSGAVQVAVPSGQEQELILTWVLPHF